MSKRLKKKIRKQYNDLYSKNNMIFNAERERKEWVKYMTNA
jgi:hypothetical protein